MHLKRVTLKSVILVVALLSGLSGVALARRADQLNGYTHFDQAARAPFRLSTQNFGQHDHNTGNPSTNMQLAIDGSVNPDAITDERAYDHFLSAIASVQSTKGREVVLSRIGLNPADRGALNAALGSLNSDLKSLIKRQKADRILSSQATAMQQSLLADVRTRVRVSLSRGGQELLDRHIRHEVKRRIKIYRAPMPSQSSEALQ